MSKISELSDGGSLQSTDYLIAVRSGGNVKVQPAGMTFSSVTITSSDINGGNIDGTVIGAATPAAGSFTTGQFGTSLNVDGTVTADGLTVAGTTTLTGDFNVQGSADYGVEFRGTSPSVDSIALQARFRDDTDAAYWGGANIEFIRDGNWESSITFDTSPDYTNRGGLPRLNIAKNGDISFYEDTGTTAKFFWDASAEALGLGTTSPTNVKLQLNNSGTDTIGTGNLGFAGGSTPLWVWRLGAADSDLNLDRFSGTWQTTPALTVSRSTGNVGIGTSSPDSFSNLAANNLVVGSGSANEGLTIYSGNATNNYGAIAFADGTSGTEQYRGYILYQHDVDALRFAAGATERMRIDSSGNLLVGTTTSPSDTGTIVADGVYLGGTGAANLLDDYETGTYVATVTPQTSGTITLTSSIDTLAYTKIGRQVSVTGRLNVASVSLPVGTYVTLSLPFAIANLTENSGYVGGAATVYDWSTSGYIAAPQYSPDGVSSIRIYYPVASTSAGTLYLFSFVYFTA